MVLARLTAGRASATPLARAMLLADTCARDVHAYSKALHFGVALGGLAWTGTHCTSARLHAAALRETSWRPARRASRYKEWCFHNLSSTLVERFAPTISHRAGPSSAPRYPEK